MEVLIGGLVSQTICFGGLLTWCCIRQLPKWCCCDWRTVCIGLILLGSAPLAARFLDLNLAFIFNDEDSQEYVILDEHGRTRPKFNDPWHGR